MLGGNLRLMGLQWLNQMERNMPLDMTLYKMAHSNFKQRSYENNTRVGKCLCGQTFD